nr:hypothetical protein [Chloroflexaceae bacterium]
MAELPKQLPSLRSQIDFSVQTIVDWQKLAKKQHFTDDIQHQIALLLACHRVALMCIDGDAIKAFTLTKRALHIADLWRNAPSGRENPNNVVHDYYAGIASESFNGIALRAIAMVEDILDWEFTVASTRAIMFGARNS